MGTSNTGAPTMNPSAMNPPTMNPQVSGPTPYDNAAGLMGDAMSGYQQLGNYDAAGQAQNYMNPYQDQVLDNTMGRMNTNYQLQQDQLGDAASASSAFGGGRHGVMEGVLGGEYNKNVGDVAGNINMQGYGNAMNDSFRNAGLIGQAAGGAQNLAGQYYDIGNNLQDRQMAMGDRAQAANQGVMNDAQGIFQGNDIMSLLQQYQGGLSGSPLTGNGTATGVHTPGTMEKIGYGSSAIGSLLGK